MSDRRAPLLGRWSVASRSCVTALAATLALIGCTATKDDFTPLPVATEARIVALTLDVCDCASCRVAVQDPVSDVVLFSHTGKPPPSEFIADACYTGPSFRATLECGLCPGPGTCTATATFTASGVLPVGSPLTCTTFAGPGTSCQDQQVLIIDTATTVSCAP